MCVCRLECEALFDVTLFCIAWQKMIECQFLGVCIGVRLLVDIPTVGFWYNEYNRQDFFIGLAEDLDLLYEYHNGLAKALCSCNMRYKLLQQLLRILATTLPSHDVPTAPTTGCPEDTDAQRTSEACCEKARPTTANDGGARTERTGRAGRRGGGN